MLENPRHTSADRRTRCGADHTLPPAQTPPDGIDPQVAARFLPLLQEYSRSNSQTMQLLYALRPFLKESKQDKVERAARLARLIHLGKKFLIDWGDGHV